MKTKLLFIALIVLFLDGSAFAGDLDRDIIPKANGNIILAYKGFERFLQTDKDWATYQTMLLEQYPVIQALHDHNLYYGFIDTLQFRKELKNSTCAEYGPILENMTAAKLEKLYDTVIQQMDHMLTPLDSVDVVFYLSYCRDCFIKTVHGRRTIYISLKYTLDEIYPILVHEYAHNLHHQRRPQEPSVLRKWIVSEGIASYFPLLLSDSADIYDGLWMMPKENVDWCMQHEQLVWDALLPDLDKGGTEVSKTYIAGGEGFATPPEGMPEKIGYYIGYRMIEHCLQSGMTLEAICSSSSQQIMDSYLKQ